MGSDRVTLLLSRDEAVALERGVEEIPDADRARLEIMRENHLLWAQHFARQAGIQVAVDESSSVDAILDFNTAALSVWNEHVAEIDANNGCRLTREVRREWSKSDPGWTTVAACDVLVEQRHGYRGIEAVRRAMLRAVASGFAVDARKRGTATPDSRRKSSPRASRSRRNSARSSSSRDPDEPAPLGRLLLTAYDRCVISRLIDAARRRQLADHERRFTGYRQCQACFLDLPETEFSRRSYCRACEQARVAGWRRARAAA